MNGIINIYKAKGLTSHDVVSKVRKILGIKKVGHTGTLDPDACGVLPVCVGKAVKLVEYLTLNEKEYVADLKLGKVTDTCDASGNILRQSPVDFDQQSIKAVVSSFLGRQFQVPPMYSAIKVQGRKLYEYARAGIEVERKPRDITIFEIEVCDLTPPDSIKLRVLCSKGTYIRALAFDIGEKLGCGAYLSDLIRTKSGCFNINNAVTLSQLAEYTEADQLSKCIISITDVFDFPKIIFGKEFEKLLHNGNKIDRHMISNPLPGINEKILVYDHNKTLIGVYEVCEMNIKPLKILI